MSKGRISRSTRNNIRGWLCEVPWLIGFAVFTLYPIASTLKMSFDSVVISATGLVTEPVGIDNYRKAFLGDVTFPKILLNYVGEIVLQVPIVIVFAIAVALILSKEIRGRGIFRTLFFLPVIIISGPVIDKFIDMGMMAIQGADTNTVIKSVLAMLPETAGGLLKTLIDSFVMTLWFSGVQILLLLSALQKIDKPMYEAAYMDGASGWECFWKVTLPNLRSMIVICIIYTIVTISTFDTNEVITTIQGNMFQTSLGLGYSSAQAWIYFVVLLLVIGFFMLLYGPRKEAVYGSTKAAKLELKRARRLKKAQDRNLKKLYRESKRYRD
jgi:oligogalacturonide transport system permease protein|nr:sugar ABC transporter permease [uncultured Acetatifactor sp.]